MRRGTWADDPGVLTRASTDSVIRTGDLHTLGVSAGAIVRRCAPGGPWQRMLPGVVLLHNGIPSSRQRHRAALAYAGPTAVLSGNAALDELGLARSSQDVLVLIPHTNHRKSVGFIDIERTSRVPVASISGGIRVAPTSRALMDAARRQRDLETCRALISGAIQRRAVELDDLAVELAAGTSRGTALPRRVLDELSDGAHSVAEIAAQKLYASTGLPPMQFNVDVIDGNGQFIARPDGWLDSVGLAWEIDSLRHHLSIRDHEATMRRRALMQRHGIIVVSHLPSQFRRESKTVRADLEHGIALASSRPRPDVSAESRSPSCRQTA
ncbi:hypothetical protein [Antrihabitans cavernicola]|uniref:DUF559 domain-containing protein n=1 Tax=Antrihabitans cavernicola TaxID=2495913 RepID=A0A5A7SCY1_9NOCA|nr:hypothetical protein [Spelaeibacter cavernicola]KAA0022587.1 hypothetical protein FOY51_12905 [Spelaeibacter cavernicola]